MEAHRGILPTSGTVLLLTRDVSRLRTDHVPAGHGEQSVHWSGDGGQQQCGLAFDNREDATVVLSALFMERHVVAAGLYDKTGPLFAIYRLSGCGGPG